MALTKSATVFFFIMALCGVSMAAVYKVGDTAGWTIIGNVDYKKWAATKTFHVGDTILFEYNTKFHNVLQVEHPDFQSCNATAPVATYTSGNDSITIKSPGHFFYLCGFTGHCQAGLKVDIRVARTSSPSPSPSHSPSAALYGSSPSVSPSLAPVPSQSSAPSLHSSMDLFAGKLGLSMVALAFCVIGIAY